MISRLSRATVASILILPAVSAPLAAQARPMENVSWLPGCWELSIGARRVLEQWAVGTGGAELNGTSVTTVNGVERESEKIRIYVSSDTLVYAAHPSRQAPAEFRARASSAVETIFENLAHDFPQRIIYRRSGADSLIASIEGERGGQMRRVAFPFKRIDCPK